MYTEILISVAPHETRVAILEDGSLSELLVEREEQQRVLGDIFQGRVKAVLPGMQAAFIDLGLEKSGFLHLSDMIDRERRLEFEDEDEGDVRGNSSRHPPIEELLRKGEEVLVQVTKEPIGGKGPRLTTQISLPGRYLVLMPGSDHLGVSRRIEDRAERGRLRELAEKLKPRRSGLIVRTVAEGREPKQLEADVKYLNRQWKRIEKEAGKRRAPYRVHHELDLTASLIRDLFRDEVDSLVIDSRKPYKQILSYLNSISPEMRSRVKLYQDEIPLFDAYQVEREAEKTLQRRVNLRGGGFIVIEQTEALVAVDVNTGRYRGGRDQEETILRTNLEAAREIARQLRLRDIGGIIVIDFIDMETEGNRRRVQDELRSVLRRDRSRTKILNISELGLVEMTRQRVRPSILHFMSDPCPYCGGVGRVFSFESMKVKVERWVRRLSVRSPEQDFILRMHPDQVRGFEAGEEELIRGWQREWRLSLSLEGDPELGLEDLRILSRRTGEDLTDRLGG